MENNETVEDLPNESSSFVSRMSVWHWLILIGISSGTILEGLVPHSFGTLIANFRMTRNVSSKFYHEDKSFVKATQFQLNWLPALSSSIPCLLLPLLSFAVTRYQRYYQVVSIFSFIFVAASCILSSTVRQWEMLFLTYSVTYSIGTSMFLAVVIMILSDYFPLEHTYHVLATSLYQIGYPCASLIGNPIMANLIVQYGWRRSLQCVAILQILLGVLVAIIMKPKDQGLCCKNNSSKEELIIINMNDNFFESFSMEVSVLEILKTVQFWPWLLGKYINYLCWYGLRTNIVTYLVRSTTFGLEWSAGLMSVYAAAEITVALLASIMGDKLRGWLVHVHIIAAAIMAILTGIFTITLFNYISAVILMIFIGIAVQFSLSFGYPASVEVLDSQFNMETGWIISNVAAGLGIMSSPVLSGLLMDKFKLSSIFYAQCVGWTLQTICFSMILIILRIKRKKADQNYMSF